MFGIIDILLMLSFQAILSHLTFTFCHCEQLTNWFSFFCLSFSSSGLLHLYCHILKVSIIHVIFMFIGFIHMWITYLIVCFSILFLFPYMLFIRCSIFHVSDGDDIWTCTFWRVISHLQFHSKISSGTCPGTGRRRKHEGKSGSESVEARKRGRKKRKQQSEWR